LNLFETPSYAPADEERVSQYRTEAKRIATQEMFANEDEFLKSLEMVAIVEPFVRFNFPRIAQLTQRSNQFNLRTIRYTQVDIAKIATSEDCLTLTVSLKDKFGDYGLTSVLILKKQNDALFIDTWLMSCRVLKRGMENFVLNEIVALAKSNNFHVLAGEYIATPRNALVKDHYASLGFELKDNYWYLDVEKARPLKNYIRKG
jgi:FkbH-like protein